jgi:putative sugar O-methyltransferase
LKNNSAELAKEFIANSPDFENDLVVEDIDDKHKGIVGSAYSQSEQADAYWENFRNWSGQGDGLAPIDLFVDVFGRNKSFKNFARYIHAKIFRGLRERFYWTTLNDDIEIIKQIGAASLLKENPISSSPNPGSYCLIDGLEINQRWARYIYLLKKILDQRLLVENDIWVDIGPFYGGLQGLVKKYVPESRIVLVDFHHQLCRSYIYLKTLYPDAVHIFPNQAKNYSDLTKLPNNSILYLPVPYFPMVQESKVDLATNFFSLGEMRRTHFKTYMDSRLFIEAKKTYLVNRFVSAPFFEKTYDSDIKFFDYLYDERHVDYFDIFPMHHYQLIERKVLNRVDFRNTSSSYFDLITSRGVKD